MRRRRQSRKQIIWKGEIVHDGKEHRKILHKIGRRKQKQIQARFTDLFMRK